MEWLIKPFNELGLKELYSILRLRGEVFILEQNCPYVDADGKDFRSHHLMGFVDGELAAYARLVQPGVALDRKSVV